MNIPPLLIVDIDGASTPPLIAVKCVDHVEGPFTWSWDLVCTLVPHDRLCESWVSDAALQRRLQDAGLQWGDHVSIMTAEGGVHSGLRALGVGSSTKRRTRAARIALAVTVACRPDADIPDPTGDGAFLMLVNLARELLRPDNLESGRDGEGGSPARTAAARSTMGA